MSDIPLTVWWLIPVLPIALAVAWNDMARMKIPNGLVYALAFISTKAKGEIARKITDTEEFMAVFMPTTPNPTSGFLLFVRKSEVIELDMSVEDAAKLVISAGLVYPGGREEAEKAAKALAR
ncbi:MAG: DUF502 domain-containing protein [Rhodobacteraceae bacterium]|nr:DUF502 domain-containing protein [Paracoccaceae bacterium]